MKIQWKRFGGRVELIVPRVDARVGSVDRGHVVKVRADGGLVEANVIAPKVIFYVLLWLQHS